MFSKYEEQAKKVLVNMKQEMISLKHPYIGSEHLLLSLLKYGEKGIKDKLKNHGIETMGRLQIGAAIGTHIGPNAFGIIYVEKA